VTILLEELNDLKGVEYDAYKISLKNLDQFGSEFVAVNPNSKIPAMLDYDVSPPLRVFESGSILKYIAEKHGAFVPTDPARRVECFNWLFWQVGAAPYIGGSRAACEPPDEEIVSAPVCCTGVAGTAM